MSPEEAGDDIRSIAVIVRKHAMELQTDLQCHEKRVYLAALMLRRVSELLIAGAEKANPQFIDHRQHLETTANKAFSAQIGRIGVNTQEVDLHDLLDELDEDDGR